MNCPELIATRCANRISLRQLFVCIAKCCINAVLNKYLKTKYLYYIMNKFLIPVDKANHFIYGYLIFCLSQIFFVTPVSALIVLIIGAAKEIVWDKYLQKGTPDWNDFAFTIAGPIPTILLELFK